MGKSKQRATYDDLLKLPENMVGEIIDGELIASPRPASPHAYASSQIGGELHPFTRRGASGPGGWWILDEPELHFHEGNVLVPDLAGWRRERMPHVPNVAAFELAPDWVCEIVSPRSGRIDRVSKKAIYARELVKHVWLVDPLQRTLEIYRLDDKHWVEVGSYAGDAVLRAEPFGEIELSLSQWWLEEEAPTP